MRHQTELTLMPAEVSALSSNWSGYVATGGTFTSVSGTWVVAHVSSMRPGADATWVGIGASGPDLIQAGTRATTTGDGTVAYEAWTEVLPEYSRATPLEVAPGNVIRVTVAEVHSGWWRITIDRALFQNEPSTHPSGELAADVQADATAIHTASRRSPGEALEDVVAPRRVDAGPSSRTRIMPILRVPSLVTVISILEFVGL